MLHEWCRNSSSDSSFLLLLASFPSPPQHAGSNYKKDKSVATVQKIKKWLRLQWMTLSCDLWPTKCPLQLCPRITQQYLG